MDIPGVLSFSFVLLLEMSLFVQYSTDKIIQFLTQRWQEKKTPKESSPILFFFLLCFRNWCSVYVRQIIFIGKSPKLLLHQKWSNKKSDFGWQSKCRYLWLVRRFNSLCIFRHFYFRCVLIFLWTLLNESVCVKWKEKWD